MHSMIDTIVLYEQMRREAWLSGLWSWLRGRPRHPLDLEQLVATHKVRTRHFVGYQTVLVHQIRGSEGRSHVFDAAFRPLVRATGDRWRGIAHATLRGVALPPVELIRVGAYYFVRDGHHRVSVARALGQAEIDAIVTVWEFDVRLPWDMPAQLLDDRTGSDRQPMPCCDVGA